jgi:CheY-like chemotaxis protein
MKPSAEAVVRSKAFKALGLAPAEERIYCMLLPRSGATVAEVSARLRVSQRSCQRVLGALESKGLVTHSPEEALNGEIPVDLLVTDVMMPGMNGPELVERMRERLPSLPVVYTSGYLPSPMDGRVRLDHDAVLLKKPLTSAGLLDAMSRLLGPGENRG